MSTVYPKSLYWGESGESHIISTMEVHFKNSHNRLEKGWLMRKSPASSSLKEYPVIPLYLKSQWEKNEIKSS